MSWVGDEYCDNNCFYCTNFWEGGVLGEGIFDGGDCDNEVEFDFCDYCSGGCIIPTSDADLSEVMVFPLTLSDGSLTALSCANVDESACADIVPNAVFCGSKKSLFFFCIHVRKNRNVVYIFEIFCAIMLTPLPLSRAIFFFGDCRPQSHLMIWAYHRKFSRK